MALRCASQVTFFGGSDASKRLETELKQGVAEPRKISEHSPRDFTNIRRSVTKSRASHGFSSCPP